MMLTAREIAKELGEDAATVRAVLSSIDQAAIVAAEQAKMIVEIWDGSSTIQGVPASHWEQNGLPPGGKMYLIKDASNGLVMFAQPFAPGVMGFTPMTDQTAMEFGTAHRNQIAEQAARAAIIRAADLALDAV